MLPDATYESIDRDITFVAQWRLASLNVTFNPGSDGVWTTGQGAFVRQSISHRQRIPVERIPMPSPISPTTSDDFEGWMCSNTGMIYAPDELPMTMITNNVTFTAVWRGRGLFTVTFRFGTEDRMGRHPDYPGQQQILLYGIPFGSSINFPTGVLPPAVGNYVFAGWRPYPRTASPYRITEDTTFTALWELPYVVIFDLAGGQINEISVLDPSHDHDYEDEVPVPEGGNPIRTGYNFVGWRVPHDGNNYPIGEIRYTNDGRLSHYVLPAEGGIPTGYGGTLVVTADWTPHFNNVIFNPDGGEFATPADAALANQRLQEGWAATLPELKDREGWLFDGWVNIDNDIPHYRVIDYNRDQANHNDGVVEFTAQWGRLHTVTFDPAEGTRFGGGDLEQQVPHNGNAILPLVTRPGCIFNGWYPVGGYNNITSARELTAQWLLSARTVTFTHNDGGTLTAFVDGGVGEINSHANVGQYRQITFTATPDANFEVISWDITGGNPVFESDTVRVIEVGTENINVTVTFEPIPRTLTFSADGVAGGEITAAIGNIAVTSGSIVYAGDIISFTATTSEGIRITGWTVTGGALYGTDTDLIRTVEVSSYDIEVAVTFGLIPYTVTFNPNGGTITKGSEEQQITHGENAAPPQVERDGWTFTGWLPADGYNNVTSGRTLTAQWTQNVQRVNFSVNGRGGTLTAVVDESEITSPADVGQNKNIKFTAEPVENYRAPRWYITGGVLSGNDTTLTHSVTVGTEDINVTVTFERVSHTVTFNPNRGTITAGSDTQQISHGGSATPPTVERDGWTFTGWLPADGYNNVTTARELTAQWTPSKYRTIIIEDGGTGAYVNPNPAASGETITLYAGVNNGYMFTGWRAASPEALNISGAALISGAEFIMPDDYVVLYADWTRDDNYFMVTFDANGGIFTGTPRMVKCDNAIGILPGTHEISKQNYFFLGWFTDPDDLNTLWDSDTIVTADVTLYARWRPPGTILGDSDSDGRVTSADATLIAKYIAKQDVDICLYAADLNGDGKVDIYDLILLSRWLVGRNDVKYFITH